MAEADVFAAVASPTRRHLLGLLLEHGPKPVQELAYHFDMRRPSLSEHLKVLKDAGLVVERRAGRQRLYSLRPEPLREMSAWLTPYERFWRERLSSLRDLLDTEDTEDTEDTDNDNDRDDGGDRNDDVRNQKGAESGGSDEDRDG